MKIRWLFFFSAYLLGWPLGSATPALTQLHSFGLTNTAAANPYSRLLQASDGILYGTTSAGGTFGQGTVFRLHTDGSGFQLLKIFGSALEDGSHPFSGLVEASDGFLYGTTEEGGKFGVGSVYKMTKDGASFAVVKHFTGGSDGAYPEAGVLEGSDHLLYGTTSGGGTNDSGVVFRLNKDGSVFTTLVQFNGTNGANPEGELIEASDGLLYGTTSSAIGTNLGSIFRMQKDGGNFSVVKLFHTLTFRPLTVPNEGQPQSRLIEGTNGLLYGTTPFGGTNTTGTIYSINKDGTGFRTLYHFAPRSSKDGRLPLSGLLLASDGNLYGTTYDGGTNGNGAIFKIDPQGTNYIVVASLSSAQGASADLMESTNGILFGVSQLGGDAGDGTVFSLTKDGSAMAIVKSFSASGGDGRTPYAAPTSSSNGLLFGTTRTGGGLGIGNIYTIRFDGEAYNPLSSLAPIGTNASPVGGLLQLTNGLLYGITQLGGSSNAGAIFSLDTATNEVALVYSAGSGNTGIELRGDLIQASDGLLYGTTVSDGGSGGQGVVFRVKPDGSGYTVIKNFAWGATGPGANPIAPLLEASDGNLYGTTYDGGITNRGVLFSLSKNGSTSALLKSFGSPASDGENPMSALVEDGNGMLYGCAYGGGSTNNAGTVFGIKKDGTGFHVLATFVGTSGDARHPCGRLVIGTDGALYGTTERGGLNDQGALFKVNTDGTGYTILASFGGSLGIYPRGGLVQGPDGALYGTTDQGGDLGFGTVFRYGPHFGDIIGVRIANHVPTVTALGQPGTNYVLEHTGELGPLASWVPIYTTNAPANGTFTVADQSSAIDSAKQGFYRLKR